jgi:hypothetical protein
MTASPVGNTFRKQPLLIGPNSADPAALCDRSTRLSSNVGRVLHLLRAFKDRAAGNQHFRPLAFLQDVSKMGR